MEDKKERVSPVHVIKYIAVFAVTAVLLGACLMLSALIPQSALRENFHSSAEILCRRDVFFELVEGSPESKIDRYADSIELAIAYSFDSGDPAGSVMRSAYYHSPDLSENEALLAAVDKGCEAEREYLRYWHGEAVLVRIAHLFTDIRGMYIINTVLAAVLYGVLICMLIKRKLYGGAVGILAALIAAGIWYVPYCLEYAWVFLMVPIVSIAALHLTFSGHRDKLGIVFLVTGIVANYLDLLTAETVTLTIPLLLTVYASRMGHTDAKAELGECRSLCMLWGVGYAGMWIFKWAAASLILGENVMPYVEGHITERMFGGATKEMTVPATFGRNIGCLVPFSLSSPGIVIGAMLLIAAVGYTVYMHLRGRVRIHQVLVYLLPGAVPFVRYAVLLEHSYIHFFFTYRALSASVLALCLIISETVVYGRGNGVRERKNA